ncbi:peptide deformylase [Opitutaceae bacterium TAV4]|nr:peptide deformylase [Opitutaceae bacterium TAV4]RRK00373.1 peptide deformylase [Opitutaceae bacterium TAV3]
MVLSIVHYNNPVLRKKGDKVSVFDAELARLGVDMVETMHAAKGIGLAAQQVGRAIQFCVVDVRAADRDYDWELDGTRPPVELFMPLFMANPEITPVEGCEKVIYEEGCLSFPGIRGDVKRPEEICVRYQDAQGVPHTLFCNGILARCIQHEADHLAGTLFIDRMAKRIRAGVEQAVRALADEEKAERLRVAGSE